MNTTYKRFIHVALIGSALFTSCSRPTAYFQRGPAEAFNPRTTQTVPTVAPLPVVPSPTESVIPEQVEQAQSTAYVRNDNKQVASKKLGKRIDHMKHLIVASQGTQQLVTVATPRKLNLVERAVLRKLNKQISHRLAPAHPEKAMLTKAPILIGGAVLLIGGLFLLILGTGTVAFIGLIASLIGALGVILGLFEY
ncbi:hypothetical protein [Spirosoma gilvum]